MKPESRTLSIALGISILLHGLPFVPGLLSQQAQAPAVKSAVLNARLETAPQEKLSFKEVATKETASEPPPPKKKILSSPLGSGPKPTARDAVKQALSQLHRNLPYPQEAVRRGLEGEALITVFLDETGNAIAARIEASSGHDILDQAATRAAKLIRGLPDSAPREVTLPVHFRLKN